MDYADIKARRDAIAALPSRTQAQSAELASYTAKLAHDDNVIGLWLQRLSTLQGRTVAQVTSALGNATNLQIRAQVLAALKANEEARATEHVTARGTLDGQEPEDIRKIQREIIDGAISGDPVQSLVDRVAQRRALSADLQAREAARLARAQAIAALAAGSRTLGT